MASLSTGLINTNSSVASLSTGLADTNVNVNSLSTSVANGVAGPVRYGSSPTAPGSAAATPNDAYLYPGSGTGPVVLHNVAPGKLTATSTDAVNGSQIYSLGSSLASALGGGSTFNQVTGAVTAPSYRVQGSNYSNVGGAITALDNGLSSLQNNMNSVAATLESQIVKNRKIAAGGAASATAMSQVRYRDLPGSQSLGIGGGFYDNQAAMAIGYGFTSEDGAWRGNASVSYAPGAGKFGVGAGLSYSW